VRKSDIPRLFPTTTVKIRALEWNDYEGWARLYYTRYEEVRTDRELGVYTRDPKPTLPEEAEFFGKMWKGVLDGDYVAVVAEDEGMLIGACTVVRRGNHCEDRHIGVLAMMVHPRYRDRGVGTQLLAQAIERSVGKFEIIELTVMEKNLRAKHLYEKFGFVESGRLPRAFKRDGQYFDDLLMWRPTESASKRSTS
jgi:ribosomal protein S18 acetylase RimI-like enzyme